MYKLPRFCLLSALLLFVSNLNAQNEIDSLRKILNEKQSDTSRVNTYLQFYYTDLFYSDNQAVVDYTYQALALSKRINFERGIVEAHTTLGGIYRINGKSDSALFHYEQALDKANDIAYYSGQADAIMGLGNTYNRISNWKMAVSQFEKVIELANAVGDSVKVASAHNNIGNTYLNQGMLEKALMHYQSSLELGDEDIRKVAFINVAVVYTNLNKLENAREYYAQALEIAKRDNNLHHMAFIYKNLGVVEKKSKNYDKALEYYTRALEVNEKVSDQYNISEIQYNMGNILFEQAAYSKAIDQYERSLAIQRQINHKIGACYSLLAIGMSHKELGNYNQAITALEEAETMADSTELLTAKTDIARVMSDMLTARGDFKKALEYQIAFKQLSDSLTAIRSEEKIAELETKYQTTQKEQEIELLSAENQVANLQLQKQQNLRNYLIILAVILVLLVAVAYSRYQIKVRANNKLRELDSLKTNFFTNISHEFRTPLTLILSPLEKVLKKQNDHEVVEDLNVIKRNAYRLLELINQLLDLSKLEAGKLKLQVKKGNLQSFLEIVSASFESLASIKHIDFKCDFENLSLPAYYDEDKLQKILNNLLSNAFKYTPEGGKVKLSAAVLNDHLTISVQDTGPGLSPDQQVEIFNRFHQNKQSAKVGGTGIGLTLTKELVTLHHGTINIKSGLGDGSTFSVTLPVSQQAYSSSEIEEGNFLQVGQNGYSNYGMSDESVYIENGMPIALIVEDNPDLRAHLHTLLKDSYSVHQAHDGKQGVEKAIELVPDIIISDLMMPELDGLGLCSALKTDQRTSHIPIILLTAKADKPSKLEGLKTGADDYLIKPFDAEELHYRMKNLIDQRANLRERFASKILIAPSKILVDSPDELFIKKAIQTVEEHLSEPEFTVEIFQKEIGMSRMQLHRKLKALTNHSASEFIRNLRLQRAADLLAVNGTSVADAAYASGFNSLSYFAQCFKEKYGVSPSKFEAEVN